MNSTTTPLGVNFTKDLVVMFMDAFSKAQEEAARTLWSGLLSFLYHNWLMTILVLLLILVLAGSDAFITRRWAWLGSVLYNYLYFGSLFIIGLVCGPEIFVSIYFDIIAVILYVVCFKLVWVIISKFELNKPRPRRVRNW